MGRISLQQAALWCGGSVQEKYKEVTFLGANNDSRRIQPGQLFLALQGVRDGHDFIPAALEKGAAAVLCTHCDGDYPAIVVPDVRLALGEIAKQERLRLGMKVVGITGSVGKSTTKEMVAAVLEGTYRVAKTPANHNNDIGMPMAILSMPEDTQVAVVEMGMNHFREIAYLTEIARPELAVVVNIGTMHIEFLGSREGILKAKMEIQEGMPENGTLYLNGDDALLWRCQGTTVIPVQYFGVENDQSQVQALDVQEQPGGVSFRVKTPRGDFSVNLPVEGLHYVHDALAAVSVGLGLDVPLDKIREGLESFQNMEGRQEIMEIKGYTIIKDCYNAGPESMAAALRVLHNRPGRHVAVLGDMLELGFASAAEHYKVGRIAAEQADLLFAYGPSSSRVLGGAITGGMPLSRAKAFEDRSKLVKALKQMTKPGDVLLFKGSRGMRMELALEEFLKTEE